MNISEMSFQDKIVELSKRLEQVKKDSSYMSEYSGDERNEYINSLESLLIRANVVTSFDTNYMNPGNIKYAAEVSVLLDSRLSEFPEYNNIRGRR